ncbi:MAG: outer membrane beta-barrel protein [Candidatus Symbiothrix sp.]|jgi:hypothetical protein|nr:outer membrane beta-barrel protein [Candidatus Symbiothrix sp.]
MKIVYISLFLCFLSTTIIAQSNYIEGYVITNKLDTVSGWIDFKTDKENFSQCKFKSSKEESTAKTYLPGEIHGYRFKEVGKFYVSHKINIDAVEKEVFLEFLVNGTMNLYYYSQNDEPYYFFENETGDWVAVTKKPDKRITSYQSMEDNQYIGYLNYLFADYPSMKNDINKSKFERKSMIELTKEYHELSCTTGEPCIEFENNYKEKFINLTFTVYAGITHSGYVSDYDELKKALGSDKFNCTAPTAGIQLGVSNPRFSKTWSLLLDVSLANYKIEERKIKYSTYYEEKIRETNVDYTIKALLFAAKLNIRYTYHNKSKFVPYIEGGIDFDNLFNRKDTYSYIRLDNGKVMQNVKDDNYTYQALSSQEDRFLGYNAGIGLNYRTCKKQSVFLGLNYTNTYCITPSATVAQDQMRNLSVKLGYTF